MYTSSVYAGANGAVAGSFVVQPTVALAEPDPHG